METKFHKILSAVALALLLAGGASAYLPENGYTALGLSGGARELGMGGAVYSRSENLSGVFYNPAVINRAFGLEVGTSRYDSIVFSEAFPLDPGNTWGFSAIGGNQYKTNSLGQKTNLQTTAIVGTYSQRLAFYPNFQNNWFMNDSVVGVSGKYLLSSVLDTGTAVRSGGGFEMDLGWLYEPRAPFSVGAALTNMIPMGSPIGGTIHWDDGTVEGIPVSLNTGVAVKLIGDQGIYLNDSDNDLLVQAGIMSPLTSLSVQGNVNIGLEFSRRDTYYVRSGINNLGLALGLGYRSKEWGGDLAYYDSSAIAATFSYYPEAWRFKEKIIPETDGILSQLALDQKQFITNEAFVVIGGKVQDGYRLTINGNLSYADKDGMFSTFVPLNVGKNIIRVVARSEWEKQTIEYRVLRKAKILIAEEDQIDQILKGEIDPAIAKLTAQVTDLSAKINSAKSKPLKASFEKELKASSANLDVLERRKAQLNDRLKELAEQKDNAVNLVSMGILDNPKDSKFELNKSISRSEFAVLIAKSTGIPIPDVFSPVFDDVQPSDPNAPYIKLVKDLGIMRAVDNNNFYPDRPVTEKEGKDIFSKLGAIE